MNESSAQSPARSAVLVGDDVFPRIRGFGRPAPDQPTLKALTLLHDCLYFDVIPEQAYETLDRYKDMTTQQRDAERECVRTYEDLFATVKEESPRHWQTVQEVWRPLPHEFNTVENAIAYRGVEYGATSDLPGFLELDYFLSAALQYGCKAARNDPHFTKDEFNHGMHAAWLWSATGVGYATQDNGLFQALRLFARCGRQIQFSGKSQDLEQVLAAVRQWNPEEDKLFQNSKDESPTHTLELLIPDFEQLSWDEVIALRENRFYGPFKEWYARQCVKLDAGASVNSVEQEATAALWKLTKEVQPNVTATIVKGVIGNLPIPVFGQIYGIGSAAMDVYSDVSLKNRYGWLFWLSEARDVADAHLPQNS